MTLRLREIERHDLASINRWRNDPEVVASLGSNFHFIGPEVDERWFERYLSRRPQDVRLAILANEHLIGVVYLLGADPTNRDAEFAIMIGERAYWSRGFGEAATRAMLAHAFNDLNLHRVHLSVLAENHRAIRLYQKVGFRAEGTLEQAVFKNGAYRDVVLMALLAPRYRATGN